jgi:hypothetical protein
MTDLLAVLWHGAWFVVGAGILFVFPGVLRQDASAVLCIFGAAFSLLKALEHWESYTRARAAQNHEPPTHGE